MRAIISIARERPARFLFASLFLPFALLSCSTTTGVDPLADYAEVDAATILDAPEPLPGQSAPERRELAFRGQYLVELLGCGACHTDGALVGVPDREKSLAGSQIGIAWSNPLGDKYPGIVYAPNITPDIKTGIGRWSDMDIARAVRTGIGRHGGASIEVMPWPAYNKISDDDIEAITAYLRSVKPIAHRVPDNVAPGRPATAPFVYFGVYQSRH